MNEDNEAYYETISSVLHILYPFRALDGNEEVLGNLVIQPETLWYLTGKTPDSWQGLFEEWRRNANAAGLVSITYRNAVFHDNDLAETILSVLSIRQYIWH